MNKNIQGTPSHSIIISIAEIFAHERLLMDDDEEKSEKWNPNRERTLTSQGYVLLSISFPYKI